MKRNHLPYCFILDGYRIQFLSKLLSKSNIKDTEAMGFLAQVHTPTVTLPRIKALTTGSIPGFVDVFLNFGKKEIGKVYKNKLGLL